MFPRSIPTKRQIPKIVCMILGVLLLTGAATRVAAITAHEVMENALDVYEGISIITRRSSRLMKPIRWRRHQVFLNRDNR